MEAIRDNASRHGLVFWDRRGHGGAANLFTSRRQRQYVGGLLTEEGYQANYVLFRPSRLFARIIGDGVLRLNQALYGFRDQAADHVMFLEGDRLEAYYRELDHLVEQARDRLAGLVACCGKGFEGEFAAALESEAPPEPAEDPREAGMELGRPESPEEESTVVPAAGPHDPDPLEALRETAEEQGILTDLGRREGWVAFRPCPFYGRFLGDVAYTLNDALLRVEGRTSYFIASGSGDVLRQYYEALENQMTALRTDLEGVMAFCARKAA